MRFFLLCAGKKNNFIVQKQSSVKTKVLLSYI